MTFARRGATVAASGPAAARAAGDGRKKPGGTARAAPPGRTGPAGTVGTALVVNVPGSPKGAVECLEAVVDVVPHAVALLADERPH